MTPEDSIVCLCTRQNFSADHWQNLTQLCHQHAIDWDIVYNIAKQHQVLPLVYHNLSKYQDGQIEIPRFILNEFKKTYIHNIFVKKETSKVLKHILNHFNQSGIPIMLVKGEALNILVYEQPWYTISYDVDIVMRTWGSEDYRTDHHDIANVIEEFNHQTNEFKEHIEYDYYEHHDITMNNVLPVDFDRIWQEAYKVQIHGCDVFVMTPEDMLLTAAIQSCRKRFFRLKALCDIASIIDKYPDLNWDLVISKAQEYECNSILYTALSITRKMLGCQLPENILSDLGVNRVRAAIIQRLITSLYHKFSLIELFDRTDAKFLGREFSWPLLLTYTSYRFDQLIPKLGEIYTAWRNPPPPVPG